MREKTSTQRLALLGMMTALVFAGNYARIVLPVPVGGVPSFTLANIACVLSGLLLGPVGGLASGLGSALYDLTNPVFAPECWLTFLTKGAMGLGAGLVAALCVFCGQLDYSAGALAVYTIRVVMGPQDDAFTEKGIATFLGETYSVTNEFDRMGCRMDGPVIEHVTDGNIISDGIAFGAIQVPTEGKPIIMMADRQTTGGYTKIANVISADFRLLGQLKAGDKVKFEKVSIQAAQEALLNQRAALRTLRRSLDM